MLKMFLLRLFAQNYQLKISKVPVIQKILYPQQLHPLTKHVQL